MLAGAPAGMLDRWREYSQRHAFGEEWLQTSIIATSIVNAIKQVAAGMGGVKLKESDLLEPDALMPKPDNKPRPTRKQTLQELQRAARMMTGF